MVLQCVTLVTQPDHAVSPLSCLAELLDVRLLSLCPSCTSCVLPVSFRCCRVHPSFLYRSVVLVSFRCSCFLPVPVRVLLVSFLCPCCVLLVSFLCPSCVLPVSFRCSCVPFLCVPPTHTHFCGFSLSPSSLSARLFPLSFRPDSSDFLPLRPAVAKIRENDMGKSNWQAWWVCRHTHAPTRKRIRTQTPTWGRHRAHGAVWL